jgi:phage shock protein C
MGKQMYCTQCGFQLREADAFCPTCGRKTRVNIETPARRALTLDKQRGKIAGVCAGFANYMDVDVVLVRVLWLGLALGFGVGFLAYVAAWIVIPSGPRRDEVDTRLPQTS